jgi:hypothetical protein
MKTTSQTNMDKILLDTSPKIATGFTVPDTYFDDFEQNSVHHFPKQNKSIIQFLSDNKKWFIGAAAVITLTSTLLLTSKFEEPSDVTEVENHLLYNSTITDDDIINLLDQDAISAIKIDTITDSETLEAALIDESNVENYLTN